MTEQNATTQETTKPEATKEAAPATTEAKPFKAYATAEDFEAHKAKILEESNKELAKLRRQLEAKESTDEKAAREAAEKQASDTAAAIAKAEKRGELKAHFQAMGKTPEQARAYLSVLGEDFTGSTTEAQAKVADMLGVTFDTNNAQRLGPGQGGIVPDSDVNFSPEKIQELHDTLGPAKYREYYLKHREAIDRAAAGGAERQGFEGFKGLTPAT